MSGDLSTKKDQDKLMALLDREDPELVVGSPPCTVFSMLQQLNWAQYSQNSECRDNFMKELEKAKAHVAFFV